MFVIVPSASRNLLLKKTIHHSNKNSLQNILLFPFLIFLMNTYAIEKGRLISDFRFQTDLFQLLSSIMIVKCDSDATAFILHCTFTSVFCLRRECRSLKSGFLFVLALSDWLAVLCQTFNGLILENSWWLATACLCEQPRVWLQTGKYGTYILVNALATIYPQCIRTKL